MKRVYWVHRKGNTVLGEVLLAEGLGTNENLLQEARDEAEKVGLDLSYGTLEIYEEDGKMEKRIKEIFNLEWIQDFAEQNIRDSEWIEESCGEKRRILVIETLVHGGHGAYIPGMVLELFGQAEGYDLEDPYNYDKNETIHEALMFLENEITDCLNQLLPSKGTYYVGYHEYDGSYCLFYEEYEEEAEQV